VTTEIKRLYSMSDAVMLEKASVMRAVFVEALPTFTGYSAIFDTDYSDTWNDEILLALQTPTAEQTDDMGAALTQIVLSKMRDCRKAYRAIKFFVGEAFGNNAPVQNEFGFDDYQDVRKSQPRMIYFMQRLHKTAEKYATQLLAASCPQNRIDELLTLANDLLDANVVQEAFKKNRPGLTAARIILMNDVWKRILRVSQAGKVIYSDNYAEYQKYVIYGSSGGGSSEQVFEGMIPGGGIMVVFDLPYNSNRVLLLSNPGNVPVEYYLSENISDPAGMLIIVNPSDSITYIQGDLGPSGNYLIARNPDPLNIAEYSVTIDDSI
jgi:hypothetical protein